MNSNGKFQDPYCNKNFWLHQFSSKSYSEIEECLNDFDRFACEIENEFRIVMSSSRAEQCREALFELHKLAHKRVNITNQGELFD